MRGVYALAAVVTIIVVVIVAGRLYTSNADFNAGNPYASGYSKVYAGQEITEIYRLSDLPSENARGTALLVVDPQYPYRPGDAAAIAAYLNGGGNLVVIDSSGMADSLLSGLSTSIRVDPAPLYQDDKYDNSPAYPIIGNASDSGIVAGVSQICLSHPASLDPGLSSTVLASTSNKGWRDANGNGIKDKNESYGIFPVIARESFGIGSVTVIADPEMFSNGMIGQGDNEKLAAAVLDGRQVYLDLTHSPGIPTLASARDTVSHDRTAQILLIIAVLLIAFVGYVMIKRFYPGPEEDDGYGNLEIDQERLAADSSDDLAPATPQGELKK